MTRLWRATLDEPPLVLEGRPGELEPLAGEGAASARARVGPLPVTAADRAAGRLRCEVVVDGWRFEVVLEDAARAALRARATQGGTAGAARARLVVRAQIPGRIVSVGVHAGETVEAGQRLLSVEAMKMENEIRAQRDGLVERVAVAPGQRVERGDELAVLA